MALRTPLSIAVLFTCLPVLADHQPEEITVYGATDRLEMQVDSLDAPVPDSAALLRKLPGANINMNGPVTGIQQYRGMFGNRVSVAVDGMHISSGGPNLMDPPLHYAPATMLQSLTVYRGIAPVSVAQESIGGAIIAETAKGEFGDNNSVSTNGAVTVGGQSVNSGWVGNALLAVGNDTHKGFINGLSEAGDDARFPDGKIRPSEYDRSRLDAGYAFQNDGHSFDLSAARSETGHAGTPALPMDIKSIDANLYQGNYHYKAPGWAIEAGAHGNDVDHVMNNFTLRQPPADASRYRENHATGNAYGYKVAAEFYGSHALWRFGTDGQFDNHNSDISNPNAGAFFVTNFNDSERQVLGVFGETEWRINTSWELNAGLRYNQVSMDSGVVGSSMEMMMPAVGVLARRFNSADRNTTDNNLDWIIRGNWSPDAHWTYTAAIARKSRSAAYQEKFLWLPMQATGGLADGNNYVGDIDLKPEVAHEVEIGFDWQGERGLLTPRLFYRHVDDYIQGVPSTDPVVNMVSQMMGNPNPLQFTNVEAKIYGFDMEWGATLSDHWSLYGLLNYVRGEREDIRDDLYRIAPPNTTLGLRFNSQRWQTHIETVAYARQNHVSETNSESETAGHAIVNFAGQVNLVSSLTLAVGIDNLLDRQYQDHLNGINRAVNQDIPVGEKLPGWGRNVYARLRWTF